jgi:hypothetical protein
MAPLDRQVTAYDSLNAIKFIVPENHTMCASVQLIQCKKRSPVHDLRLDVPNANLSRFYPSLTPAYLKMSAIFGLSRSGSPGRTLHGIVPDGARSCYAEGPSSPRNGSGVSHHKPGF